MIRIEEVVQWLKDGEEHDAATLLVNCSLTFHYITTYFDLSGGEDRDVYYVHIEAPRKAIKQAQADNNFLANQIESAIRDCAKPSSDLILENISWVPKLFNQTEGSITTMDDLCKDLEVLLNTPPEMESVYGYSVGVLEESEYVAEQKANQAISQWIKDVEAVLEINQAEDELQKWRASTHGVAPSVLNEERLKVVLKQIISSIERSASSQNRNKSSVAVDKDNFFVDPTRLEEIRSLSSSTYDLTKLVRFCDELNICYADDCFLATAMLVRAILDHVPPIFSVKNFSEVANNYAGAKSFKESMQHLEKSSRKIADSHLHLQIRAKEVLPNRTQVNFSSDLDVLLAEIVRVLK